MSRLDELPADQKAVLGLLLRQGRTYGEIADLLRIDARGVRERALNALDALGPEPDPRLDGELQDDLSDLLLGQLDDAAAGGTREALAASEPGQAWTREVAAALEGAGLGDRLPALEGAGLGDRLPALEPVPADEPHGGGGAGAAAAAAVGAAAAALIARAASSRRDQPDEEPAPTAATPAPAPAEPPTAVTEAPPEPAAAEALPEPGGPVEPEPEPAHAETDADEHAAVPAAAGSVPAGPVSRRGGIALITGLTLAAVALVLFLLLRGGSDGDPTPVPAAAVSTTATTTTTTGTSTSADLRTEAQVNLTAPTKASKAAAVAFVVTRGGQRLLGITGERFPPTRRKFSYAVWLYNSPTDAERLGYDQRGVGPSGKLQTGADPSQIAIDPQQTPSEQAAARTAKTRLETLLKRFYSYKRLVITRETTQTDRPGPIVAAGDITQPKGE